MTFSPTVFGVYNTDTETWCLFQGGGGQGGGGGGIIVIILKTWPMVIWPENDRPSVDKNIEKHLHPQLKLPFFGKWQKNSWNWSHGLTMKRTRQKWHQNWCNLTHCFHKHVSPLFSSAFSISCTSEERNDRLSTNDNKFDTELIISWVKGVASSVKSKN